MANLVHKVLELICEIRGSKRIHPRAQHAAGQCQQHRHFLFIPDKARSAPKMAVSPPADGQSWTRQSFNPVGEEDGSDEN